MGQPVETVRQPWVPNVRLVGGYMGETCQEDPANGVFLGSVAYSDCGVCDVDMRYHMTVAGREPCTYYLLETDEYGPGARLLGSMEGDAPDLATAGLALWEAMLVGRSPQFLGAKAIVPGPLFSSEQTGKLLERVELAHRRAFHPECFPDLLERMSASARALLAEAEALAMEFIPMGIPSGTEPQGVAPVGLLWEESLLKVRYFVRVESTRLVLVQDRSRMEHFGGNVPLFRPISHEVQEVALCSLPAGADAASLGVLMLLKFRPDPRLQSLAGMDGLTGKGLRLLLGDPSSAKPGGGLCNAMK